MNENNSKIIGLISEYGETLRRIRQEFERLTEETLAVVVLSSEILKDARSGSDESAAANRRICRIISELHSEDAPEST